MLVLILYDYTIRILYYVLPDFNQNVPYAESITSWSTANTDIVDETSGYVLLCMYTV